MKNFFKKYLPLNILLPLLALVFSNLIVYFGTRLINHLTNRTYYNLSVGFDSKIPFIPNFVLFYVLAYPFWYLTYYAVLRSGGENCKKILFANLGAKLLTGIIFVLIPTTFPRPEITGGGLGTFVLKNVIYGMDAPDNLFPSVHVLESWMSFVALKRLKGCPGLVKIGSFILMVMICISTVVLKQHVIVDIAGGIAVAEIFRLIADRIYVKKDLNPMH